MPARVPFRPQSSLIANCTVGAPVSEGVVGRWNNDLAHLLNRAGAQPVCSQYIVSAPLATGTLRVLYNRTPGINLIRVDVELNRGTGIGARMTLGVTSSAGSISLVGDGPFNGTRVLDAGSALVRSPETFTGYFLVTGITPGTAVELIFTFTNVDKAQGLAYVHVVECPLADTNPIVDPGTGATGEMGLDPSWSLPGNPIVAANATTKHGLIRAVAQLDRARKDRHYHMQINAPEDASTAWVVTSTVFAAIPFPTNNDDFALRGRAQKLYTATSMVALAYVRYICSAANTGSVNFIVTPVGGAPATTTVALANSAVWVTTSAAIALPISSTSGTGQEFDLTWEAKTSTAATSVSLDILGVISNES